MEALTNLFQSFLASQGVGRETDTKSKGFMTNQVNGREMGVNVTWGNLFHIFGIVMFVLLFH
jgi:hypothetical protein